MRHFQSNQVKIGSRHRRDTTEDYRARLEWMAEHPGEWLHWGGMPYAVPDLCEPAFQRRIVGSAESRETGVARGLWLLYRGIVHDE